MINRMYDAVDKRLNIKENIRDVLDHPVPQHASLLLNSRAFMYCFGGMSFFVISIMILTGLFMVLYYVPTPDHAYDSVEYLKNDVSMGWLVQRIHHWGASLAVVLVAIHALRVYLTGAYKNPRELNWVLGIFLLLIVLGLGFTGYLLPWTQKSYWATVVGTNMIGLVPFVGDFMLLLVRGGPEVGALTLSRFYAIHAGFLPAMMIFLLLGHFLMVRKQGISGPL